MQFSGAEFEREVLRRVPDLLAELLDDPGVLLGEHGGDGGLGVDFAVVDSRGRRFLIDAKAFSRPSVVAQAATRLQPLTSVDDPDHETWPLLVVPYMSPASAKVAADVGLNWLDLSGNASIRAHELFVQVQGQPDAYRSRGRPSSPFAPRSSRVARALLLDPERWWRQKDLANETGLDDGGVSRTVRRLAEKKLLETRGRELRPSDPAFLLDAWAEDYRFDRHEIVLGHVSGGGMDGTRTVADRLRAADVHHAFTGLPAAWAIDHFAMFRLATVFIEGDPHEIANAIELRTEPRGANVQLVAPNDVGVFAGERSIDGIACVAPVQAYLDLLHLPERAAEAARHLRAKHLWVDGAR